MAIILDVVLFSVLLLTILLAILGQSKYLARGCLIAHTQKNDILVRGFTLDS